jgi:hypothetical protein
LKTPILLGLRRFRIGGDGLERQRMVDASHAVLRHAASSVQRDEYSID